MSQEPIRNEREPGAIESARCQNCSAPLAGPFCSVCGQREHSHIMSVRALFQEVIEDVWHVDSRLWRTLRALLFKPGFLTLEFLAGRRAHYVPPFRLYLVVSVVLFVLTAHMRSDSTDFVVTSDKVAMQRTYDATQAALVAKRAEFARNPANAALKEKIDELADDLRDLHDLQTGAKKPGADCDRMTFSFLGWNGLETRGRAACHKIAEDSGAGLSRAFFENLPKMMFVLLPLLALVNKLLYLRSRRYYVEHLLFFVHLHVFLFLALGAILIGNSLMGLVPGGVHPPGIVSFALVMGLFAYGYLSMRRVYGQKRFKTFIKFGVMVFAYTICLLLTTVIAVLYSALTL